MRVLYLFNRVRKTIMTDVEAGKDHDNHFFGMYRLKKEGIEAEYLELESVVPASVARFLRKYILSIHTAHIPLLPKIRKYDIVFTSTAFGLYTIKTLLHIRKPKWVIFDYGLVGLIGSRTTLKQKFLYYLVSKADGIVTISQAEQDDLRKMFPSKSNYIQFIPLGTDTKYFSPLTLPEEKTVLSVGRDPGRDFKTLIDAVKGTDIHLKLTAKPSQLEKLQPLPLNVTIHDFSPDELIQEYAKAAIIMLPLKPRHTNDSMGCSTLVEAMAMGKAVVATNTTTMSSYITSGVNGVLVPESDVNTLRETLRSLHTDSSKRNMLGSAAREYVLKTCDASIFAHTLAGFFKQIVEE